MTTVPSNQALDRREPPISLADLGVLFVHGIGSQRRGQTLTECAGAIVGWWLTRVRQTHGNAVIERSVLTLDPGRYEPAHADVVITVDRHATATRVVLAESWWAADFSPPPFREIASWMLTYGSWVVVAHVTNYVRRLGPDRRTRLGRPIGYLLELVAVASAAGVLFLVQVALVILGIVAVIPVPSVRRWTASTVLGLESVIGDSYAFSANPIVNSAVASRVRRDLEWLSERCRAVVVVAHSQGAAVAARALDLHVATTDPATGIPQRVRKLVTYGSGLMKLWQLELMAAPPRRYPGIIPYVWLIVAVIVLVTPAVVRTTYGALTQAYAGGFDLRLLNLLNLPVIRDRPLEYMALVSVLVLSLHLIRTFALAGDNWAGEAVPGVRGVVDRLTGAMLWTDIWATRDPVPNGAMPLAAAVGVTSYSVTNTASFMHDHVTYWRNQDEFVTRIVEELNEVVPVAPAIDKDVIAAVSQRRQRRTQGLGVMRGCIALVTGVSVTLQANWLTGLGRDHLAPALGSALPASLAGGASAIAGSKYAILQALAATASLALGATAPVLAAWLWYRLPGREVWDYWQATEIHAFLRGDGAFAEVRKVAVTLLVTATLVFVFVALWTAFRGYPQALGDAADAWVGLQKYYQRYVQRFDPSWFWLRVWGLLEALIRPSGSG